jgi:hypothetical protein
MIVERVAKIGRVYKADLPIGATTAADWGGIIAGAYAFYMEGSGMDPVIRSGDRMIISPYEHVGPGDKALFIRTDGHTWVGEYLSHDVEHWRLKVYGPSPREISLDRSQWPTRHLVSVRYC